MVFALSIFDRWVHKVGLPRSFRGGKAVAGHLEGATCATTFSYVGHLFDLKEKTPLIRAVACRLLNPNAP
jgi:hypothetical protein